MTSEKMRDKFCSFLVRYKFLVLMVIVLFTVGFSLGAMKMKTDVILADLFPYNHPYLQLYGQFAQVFGSGGSGVVIAVNVKKGDIFNQQTLGKIKNITGEIELWDEVYRLDHLRRIARHRNGQKPVHFIP